MASSELEAVEAWIFEYACRHQHFHVIEELLTGNQMTVWPAHFPIADASLGLLDDTIQNNQVDEFPVAVALLTDLYHSAPELISRTDYLRLSHMLRVRIVFNALINNETRTLALLIQYFSRDELNTTSEDDDVNYWNQIGLRFRKFMLLLLASTPFKESYLKGRYEEEYGKRFAAKLKSLSSGLIQKIYASLPPTFIDKLIQDTAEQSKLLQMDSLSIQILLEAIDKRDHLSEKNILDLIQLLRGCFTGFSQPVTAPSFECSEQTILGTADDESGLPNQPVCCTPLQSKRRREHSSNHGSASTEKCHKYLKVGKQYDDDVRVPSEDVGRKSSSVTVSPSQMTDSSVSDQQSGTTQFTTTLEHTRTSYPPSNCSQTLISPQRPSRQTIKSSVTSQLRRTLLTQISNDTRHEAEADTRPYEASSFDMMNRVAERYGFELPSSIVGQTVPPSLHLNEYLGFVGRRQDNDASGSPTNNTGGQIGAVLRGNKNPDRSSLSCANQHTLDCGIGSVADSNISMHGGQMEMTVSETAGDNQLAGDCRSSDLSLSMDEVVLVPDVGMMNMIAETMDTGCQTVDDDDVEDIYYICSNEVNEEIGVIQLADEQPGEPVVDLTNESHCRAMTDDELSPVLPSSHSFNQYDVIGDQRKNCSLPTMGGTFLAK